MSALIDLRLLLPEARDQGARPTCLSFAISDGHALLRADGHLLSTDFLHFHAARRLTRGMNEGVTLTAIREALREDGQPPDALCPYAAPRDSAWQPPSGLSPRLGWLTTTIGSLTVADSIEAVLDEKRASVVSLTLTRSFYYPDRTTNEVIDDGGPDVASHAVLVVGKRVDSEGRRFLIRNSWGCDWGDAGHAWLSDEYLNRRGVAVVSFEAGGGIQ